MKKITIALSFLLMSLIANAEQALTKELIQNYFSVTEKLEAIDIGNSALFDELDDVMLIDKKETLRIVESSGVYPQVESVVDSAGFSNFREFLNVGYRLIGSMYAVQLEKHPELMQMQNMTSQVEAQIKSMKERGMPVEIIEKMEKEAISQRKYIEVMNKAAQEAKSADKSFVDSNFGWLMEVLPGNEE